MPLKKNEILKFITNDAASHKKRQAKVGRRYYEGEHDIRNMKLYYYNADGELVEDTNRSNIKISHPFFTENVDQEVQYILSGKDGFIFSDIPELQQHMDEYFNENEEFKSELSELLTGTISKGFEYMYAYKNEENKIAFECADSIGVIEVRGKDTDDGCDYVIYWYTDRIEKGKKEITRIQVWDKEQTYYYVRSGNGRIEDDKSQPLNPRPHTLYTSAADPNEIYYEGFGFIPFFRLDNCKKQFSGLKPIKELIDDYDLMSCGLSNNLQDASEYLVVVSGFQGNNLEQLMQNLKTKKTIGVDSEGGVEYKTVDVPYEARKAKLDLDEKNIYRFGMAFNSSQIGDGNVTNVVIKSRYALLDMKANKLQDRLTSFLKKLIKIVIKEINDETGANYSVSDVKVRFTREIITNAADNAQIEKTDAERKQVEVNTLLNTAGKIDDETIIKKICDILDVDFNEIKDKIPKNALDEADAALQTLENIPAV